MCKIVYSCIHSHSPLRYSPFRPAILDLGVTPGQCSHSPSVLISVFCPLYNASGQETDIDRRKSIVGDAILGGQIFEGLSLPQDRKGLHIELFLNIAMLAIWLIEMHMMSYKYKKIN